MPLLNAKCITYPAAWARECLKAPGRGCVPFVSGNIVDYCTGKCVCLFHGKCDHIDRRLPRVTPSYREDSHHVLAHCLNSLCPVAYCVENPTSSTQKAIANIRSSMEKSKSEEEQPGDNAALPSKSSASDGKILRKIVSSGSGYPGRRGLERTGGKDGDAEDVLDRKTISDEQVIREIKT